MREQFAGRLVRDVDLVEIPSDEEWMSFPGIKKERGKYRCSRCGECDQPSFIKGPCTCEAEECVYCQTCIQLGKIKSCTTLYANRITESFPIPDLSVQYKGELSPEQKRISEELVAVVNNSSIKEHFVWAVTGAGKTEMIYEVIRYVLLKGKLVCIAAPRIDVCLELAPRIKEAFDTVSVQVLYGGSDTPYTRSAITIATTHQLLRFYHAFDLLIVDEQDAFPYSHSSMLQHASKQAVALEGTLIYLTATPEKTIQRKINNHQLSHHLLPARYHRQPLIVPRCQWIGDWKKQLGKQRLPNLVHRFIVDHLQRSIPFLFFVPTIEVGKQVVKALERRRIPSARYAFVSSLTPDRLQLVQEMRDGNLDFLIATSILERGVTFKGIDVYVLGSEERIFTQAVLVQMAGRVGRVIGYTAGEVVFAHFGCTKEMKDAIATIRSLNQEARKRGLLNG